MLEKPQKLDNAVIDHLFNCLEMMYGDRWQQQLIKPHRAIFYRSIWQSALIGLTEQNINDTLPHYQALAKDPREFPPTPMEFYREAKKRSNIRFLPSAKNEEFAKSVLADIKSLLHGGAA